MYNREQAEKRVDDQWSSRAKKKVEYHQDILWSLKPIFLVWLPNSSSVTRNK